MTTSEALKWLLTEVLFIFISRQSLRKNQKSIWQAEVYKFIPLLKVSPRVSLITVKLLHEFS